MKSRACLLGCAVFLTITFPHVSMLNQTGSGPVDTVQKLFELLNKEDSEGIARLLVLPEDADQDYVRGVRQWLAAASRELKRRGGVASISVIEQQVRGSHAELNVEIAFADGFKDRAHLVLDYDQTQWRTATTGELNPLRQTANELSAISSLLTIAHAEVLHQVSKGRGRFTDLATLGKEGFIDSDLAGGERLGYLFAGRRIYSKKGHPMFDATAKPKVAGVFGTGSRSFYVNEQVIVYEAEGPKPPAATARNRVPESGVPINR